MYSSFSQPSVISVKMLTTHVSKKHPLFTYTGKYWNSSSLMSCHSMISTKTTSSSKGGVTYHERIHYNCWQTQDSLLQGYSRRVYSWQLLFDGQEDLLRNRDKCHLFYYSFLFQYLFNMVESRNSLASNLACYERTFATLVNTKPVKHSRLWMP